MFTEYLSGFYHHFLFFYNINETIIILKLRIRVVCDECDILVPFDRNSKFSIQFVTIGMNMLEKVTVYIHTCVGDQFQMKIYRISSVKYDNSNESKYAKRERKRN